MKTTIAVIVCVCISLAISAVIFKYIRNRDGSMLNFVRRVFRPILEVLLWINLAGCVISGGWTGYNGGGLLGSILDFVSSVNIPYIVWQILGGAIGLTAGVIIGIATNIFLGGLIAVFLDIGDDVTNIKAANARIEADTANIKGSAAATADVFQKMANRGAGGKA